MQTSVQLKPKNEWDHDSSSNICLECKNSFTITNRRHHCRKCGQLFDKKCSNNFVLINPKEKEVRMCDKCYDNVFRSRRSQIRRILLSLFQKLDLCFGFEEKNQEMSEEDIEKFLGEAYQEKASKSVLNLLGNVNDQDFAKLERELEQNRGRSMWSREMEETMKEISFSFSGICKKVYLSDNSEKLQKSLQALNHLLKEALKAFSINKELQNFWTLTIVTRRLNRWHDNLPRYNKILLKYVFPAVLGVTLVTCLQLVVPALFAPLSGLPPLAIALIGGVALGFIIFCLLHGGAFLLALP